MGRSWSGPLVTGLIVVGVIAILVLNFQPGRPLPSNHDEFRPKPETVVDTPPVGPGEREYPIGEPIRRNHVQVAAVWLASVTMDGMDAKSSGPSEVIHLEADIKALDDNPNGFAKDEFVPYLKVKYAVVPAAGGSPIDQGDLYPMIASDGLHYGANIANPKPGAYRLIYDIEPPSAGGLGRHVGKGGVAPWWKPFRAEFEWKVEAPSTPALVGGR